MLEHKHTDHQELTKRQKRKCLPNPKNNKETIKKRIIITTNLTALNTPRVQFRTTAIDIF